MGLGVAARPDPRPRPRPRARIRSVLRELAALGVFLLDGITGRGRRCCHEAMMGAGPGRSSEEANVSHAVCRARARARDPRASMHACVSVCACVACTAGRAGVRPEPVRPTTTGHGRPGTVHCTGLQISRGDERVAGTCPCPRLPVRILFSHLSAVDRWRVAVRFFFLLFFIGRFFLDPHVMVAGVIAVHLNFSRPGFAYYRGGGGGGILYSAVSSDLATGLTALQHRSACVSQPASNAFVRGLMRPFTDCDHLRRCCLTNYARNSQQAHLCMP
jgi:hypothetical protein